MKRPSRMGIPFVLACSVVEICCGQDAGREAAVLKAELVKAEKEVLAAQAEFGKKLPSMPEYKDGKAAVDDFDAQLEAARKSKDEAKIEAAVRAKGVARKHLDEVIAELKAKFLGPANAKVAALRAETERASRENDLAKMRAEAAAVKIPRIAISDLKAGQVGRLAYPGSPVGFTGKPFVVDGTVVQVVSETELLVDISWNESNSTLWLSGRSTKELVDGSAIQLDGIYEVMGRKRYHALLGDKTVFEIRRIAEKDAIMRLGKK